MRSFLILGLSLFLSAAHAQDVNPFIGKWSTGPQPKLLVKSSSFEITETGGTWKNYPAGPRSDACAKATAPMTIEEKSDKAMTLKVALSEVASFCEDFKFKLVLGDDKQVSAFRNGTELKLTRD